MSLDATFRHAPILPYRVFHSVLGYIMYSNLSVARCERVQVVNLHRKPYLSFLEGDAVATKPLGFSVQLVRSEYASRTRRNGVTELVRGMVQFSYRRRFQVLESLAHQR